MQSPLYYAKLISWYSRIFAFNLKRKIFPKSIGSNESIMERYSTGKFSKPKSENDKRKENIAIMVSKYTSWKNYREGLVRDGHEDYEIEEQMMLFESKYWDVYADADCKNLVTGKLYFLDEEYDVKLAKVLGAVDFFSKRDESGMTSHMPYAILDDFLDIFGSPDDIEKMVIDADLSGNRLLSDTLKKHIEK